MRTRVPWFIFHLYWLICSARLSQNLAETWPTGAYKDRGRTCGFRNGCEPDEAGPELDRSCLATAKPKPSLPRTLSLGPPKDGRKPLSLTVERLSSRFGSASTVVNPSHRTLSPASVSLTPQGSPLAQKEPQVFGFTQRERRDKHAVQELSHVGL